ncbi:MAG: HAMP domain-containing histidine kinase [bacterium]|nr:HAMP domain-containing histidine kinase [bacterium]
MGDGRERKGERGDLRGSDADAPADERGRSRRRSHHERKAHRRAARLADQAARAERKAEKAARRAWRESERRRRRDEKRHRARERTEREVTPEEREHARAVKRARRRANQRMGFVTHAVSYAATLGLLMVTTRSFRVVLIVALAWGIGLFCHYFWALAAPRVRDRWVEQEVGARSRTKVRRERRQVETRSRRSMEDLSASIAHEIRNPITAAKSLVQQMGEDPASDENLEYAGLALSELDRVERSISHLLRYARDEEPRFAPMALSEVARAAVVGLRDRAAAQGVSLAVDFDVEGEMRGDAEKLRRVVENLVANAIDALAESGTQRPTVELLGGENLAGDEVWLRVIDNGPGIPADERARIWSPFFTTKETGTGLGLALSRKTVEAHGGSIELLSDPRQGSEFVLSFPKEPSPTSPPNARAENER